MKKLIVSDLVITASTLIMFVGALGVWEALNMRLQTRADVERSFNLFLLNCGVFWVGAYLLAALVFRRARKP
jgi:hypothetical protein